MTYWVSYFRNLERGAMCDGYKNGDRIVFVLDTNIVAETDEAAAEAAFVLHNRDDRPSGKLAPSMSVGDVVAIMPAFRPTETVWMSVMRDGFAVIRDPEQIEADTHGGRVNQTVIYNKTWLEVVR